MGTFVSSQSNATQFGTVALQTSGVINAFRHSYISSNTLDEEDRGILQEARNLVEEVCKGKKISLGDSSIAGTKASLDAFAYAAESFRLTPYSPNRAGKQTFQALLTIVADVLTGLLEGSPVDENQLELTYAFFKAIAQVTSALTDQPREEEPLFSL